MSKFNHGVYGVIGTATLATAPETPEPSPPEPIPPEPEKLEVTVQALGDDEQRYGKRVGDLQENIQIQDAAITGTLKYATGVAAFDVGEQDGNFLVLGLTAKPGVTIKTKVVGGTHGETLVDDGFCMYRITNKDEQRIEVRTEGDGEGVTHTYDLSGLTTQTQDD